MPAFNHAMRQSLLRKTAEDAMFVGFALARHRYAAGLTPEAQAELLGLNVDGLVRVALCRTPRPRHFAKDVDTICRRFGADQEVLTDILRSSP